MKIVWDERKRLANVEKHALDFADITVDFFWTAKAFPVRTGRLKAVGLIQGKATTVIFRPLGTEGVSIISMRPASLRERNKLI